MTRAARPVPRTLASMIPPGAVAKVARYRGQPSHTEHVVRGRVALRVHADRGMPVHAFSFDRRGRMHGLEREWHPNGRLRYEARWREGRQHGIARQWDERGRLIVRTRFVDGTGDDVYCGGLRSTQVSETREMVDGLRHGFERQWWTATRVWSEAHYVRGVEHGIFREWSSRGRVARGFPRYYVNGRRVDRRAYLRASAIDPTLPAIIARDDRPARPRPIAIRRA